jgi:Pilus formation protein N terminal region
MHTLKHPLLLASFVFSFTALGAEPLKLFPGWPVPLGEGARATSADPAIAEARLTGTTISVTGKKEGKTTLTITRKAGPAQTVEVEVQSTGWKLVPVLVAAQDIAEGTELTMDKLEPRSVPDFVRTTSVVKPEAASYVLQKQVLVPLQAGDMLAWSAVASSNAK